MLENPDSVYGEGFRKIKAYVEANGEPKWLEYVKKNETAPWWAPWKLSRPNIPGSKE